MNMKRFLAVALTLCMLLSLTPMGSVRATESGSLEFEKLDGSNVQVDLTQNPQLENVEGAAAMDPDELVKVIIVMEGEAVAEGNPIAALNAETRKQMADLEQQQMTVMAQIEKTVMDGEKLDVDYNYTWLLNGVATTVPYGAIAEIRAMDGVAGVVIQTVYTVCESDPTVATPNTITDGVMIGRESAWANGYTGEGMKIAIIDTGLDTDHPNFAPLGEDKLTDTSASADTVAAVLENLNASARYEGLTVADVYHNTKVVYGFNYCDDVPEVNHYDDQGDHGTHVAGIAAANKVAGSEVVGVAPDAQIYVMKVFGENGGAYTMDILAALEDALMLGADVVNMSLGSPAGFTTDNYTEIGDFMDPVYESIARTGTILSVSAGNNFNSAYSNLWGTNQNPTAYPDNGVVGGPGTYVNTTTVASVENWKIQRNYINAGGYHMSYYDSDAYGLPALTTLTGAYELVVVPGLGAVEDYEGLDVTGKVALVQRGSLSFVEKHQNAEAAGAVAILVYNNTSGEFGMDMTDNYCTTPAAAISMADGAYLIAALESNPGFTVSFPTEVEAFPSDLAYTMSDFSSAGPAPDLTLAPDITAPGGNIYSTVDNGQYGLMSGTSMAAPNIAGMTALIMQYVKETFPEGTDYRLVTQNLLMSTAMPLSYDETIAYSPRSQGAGLANVFNAVTTNAYLSVEGADSVKADLGDDADRTGAYSFSFDVTNFGDTAAYYDLDTTAQTEDFVDYGGIYFMSGTPIALGAETSESSANMVLTHDVDNDGDTDSHDAYIIYRASVQGAEVSGWESESFRYDINADEAVAAADVQAYLDALVGKTSDADLEDTVLQVAAGESAEITVNVTLTDAGKTWLDTYYVNGGYVEGFTTLTARHTEGVDLSLPYLGFYGDWAESPVLDNGSYWDALNAEEGEVVGNQFPHILFSQFQGDDYGVYPGMNVYVNEPFDVSHISVSPNGDGYMDSVSDIYVSLMRNASSLILTYTDMETGEEYFGVEISNVSKTVYYSGYGQVIPFAYNLFIAEPGLYDGWEELENNTKVLIKAEAMGVDGNDTPEIWEVPVTVDLEAPELLSAQLIENEDGTTTLELTFRDNLSASVAMVVNGAGTEVMAMEAVEDVQPDENGYQSYTKSFDITGATGKIMIILSDYAVNESYYGINLGGEGTPYGDLVAYQYNFSDNVHGWVSFNADVNENETTIFTNYEMDFVAAEYVNGFVYAQTDSGALYGFKYTDMLNNTMTLDNVYITQLDNVYQDFAYSYAEGKLFGLYTYVDDRGYPTSEINSINIKGEYYDEDMWTNVEAYQEDWFTSRGGVYGLTLAIDDAGNMYVMGCNYDWDTETLGENAHLWVAPREVVESRWGSYVDYYFQDAGEAGVTMDFLQSMTWDHNTDTLYWARFDGGASFIESELYEVDASVAEDLTVSFGGCTKVGTLSGETCALFVPLNEETAASEPHTNVPEMDENVVGTPILRSSAVTMSLGGVQTLGYDIDPWYTSIRDVVWSTSDESVVTVDQNGTITAVGEGSAVITVAAAADETKFDTCTVEVSALSLKLEGIVSAQGAGIGNVSGVGIYEYMMDAGVPSMNGKANISDPAGLSNGLALATSEMGRGSIWACEYGNTGMIYEIDAQSGEVKDALMPIDGDMMFGMHYSESLDNFAAIMNFYMYIDMPMTHEQEAEMEASYDEEKNMFTWHRLDLLECLLEANGGFITGETGQGASSEIVFCGITGIDGGIKDSWGETYYYDTYKDYLGNWAYGGECSYQPDQTLILLDNVGRLWYINEVTGATMETDEWENVFMYTPDGGSIDATRPGVLSYEYLDADGNATYSVFHITKIVETPLTDMFREGTMPRITYHFSDIEFAGYTAEGDPMFALSLYDYWNNGTTNELYLFIPGHDTGEMDYETWEPIITPDRLFALGTTGENNIIASIHYAEVTGGVDPKEEEVIVVNKLAAGLYKAE